MLGRIYKLTHRKEIAQVEELLDVSLAKFLEFHKRNCSYVSHDKVFNHIVYGSFIINEDDKYENDNDENRLEFKNEMMSIIWENDGCSTEEEYLNYVWNYYKYSCTELREMALQEARNSLNTMLVVSSENIYTELNEMKNDIEPILKEYGEILENIYGDVFNYLHDGLEKCLAKGLKALIPIHLKLKLEKYWNIYLRLTICLHTPYWEGMCD